MYKKPSGRLDALKSAQVTGCQAKMTGHFFQIVPISSDVCGDLKVSE
jgi:hypothetical protein